MKTNAYAKQAKTFAQSTQVVEAINDLGNVINQVTAEGDAGGSES